MMSSFTDEVPLCGAVAGVLHPHSMGCFAAVKHASVHLAHKVAL